MDTDKLEKVYIPHLLSQFRQGSPVLFTGAGFSLSAKNAFGDSIPSYSGLCKVLWEICYPGENFDETTNLQDLYEDALLRHRPVIAERLPPILSVDAGSLPDWYATLFSLPWFKAYTLNVDDIELAVQRKHHLPRRLISISAAIQEGAHLFADTGEHLAVIHLNGAVGDIPDNVTFSTTQYAERISKPDPWYLQLTADLISRPFVFIGTRLDEPPLWQHLELRRARGGRGLRELRPRSYLVTPTLSKPRQALLAEFNVVWLPMSAEDFAVKVVKRFGPEVSDGFTALKVRRASKTAGATKLLEVGELAQSPLTQTDYLLGREPVWADIQAGRSIERESDGSVWTAVTGGLKRSSSKGAIVLTGTAGSGKSSALMRVCLRLTAEGTRVAWIDRNSNASPRDIVKAMRSDDAPGVLAISDADMFGPELTPMLRDITLSDNHPLVLLEVRSGKVDKTVNKAQLDEVKVDEISMPPLTDADISSLIEVLDKENRLGALKGKSREKQVRAFQQQAGRQLLVAMYQATTNQRFEEKVKQELFELQGEAQLIYSLVVTASALRFGLTRDEIVIAAGDRSNSSLNIIEQLLRRHLITEDGQFVRARHRVIAELLLDALSAQGKLRDVIYGLILATATKVTPNTPRSERPARLLRTFLNHDFLYRITDAEVARNLYGAIEQILSWEPHYWLQRGSLEVEVGDVGLAENFLAQARSLSPEDPYVENEWAYLLFKKALLVPGSIEAPKLVKEATDIINDLITRMRRSGNHYPYHVLGSQGLAWARRGIRNSDERARYLRQLLLRIEEGVKRYPFADELKQLHKDLKHELLSTSTPGYESNH